MRKIESSDGASGSAGIYGTAWRWHFYAGLFVFPVLMWMALTGGTYLYHKEIERWVYADWMRSAVAGAPLPAERLIERALRQHPGTATELSIAAQAGESWRLKIEHDGTTETLFVRPYDGKVLGSVEGGGIAETIKQLHSLSVAGPVGNVLVEVTAGWVIILVLTGFYLWWPRAGQRALSLAGRVAERRFWRNMHASMGALVGLILLFLAVTGMPWAIFWGARFHSIVAEQGAGRPTPPGVAAHSGHDAIVPWSLQGQAPPAGQGMARLGVDHAEAVARARGLLPPLTIGLPRVHGDPYVVSRSITRQQDARVIYVDPMDGRMLLDARARDFGIGAKIFDWGIYTHQGQQYGEANRLVMLAGCLGALTLSATGSVMWWKRRRTAKSARPGVDRLPGGCTFLFILLAVGALFPLTGMTMLIAIAVTALDRRRRRASTASA